MIFAWIEFDSTIRGKELAQYVGCTEANAQHVKRQYFNENKEALNQQSYKTIILTAIKNDPTLGSKELSEFAHCSYGMANLIKTQYMKTHPELKEILDVPKTINVIFAALKSNPNLEIQQLMEISNCNYDTAKNYKSRFFAKNPNKKTKQYRMQEGVFSLLGKNPDLTTEELAKLANCNPRTAYKWKQKWLEQHGAEPQEDKEA